MNKISFLIFSLLILGFFTSCKQTPNTKPEQTQVQQCAHYVSIDGLWHCTPETNYDFPNGTIEYVIQFKSDVKGQLSALGCFVWENYFYDYWEIDSLQFIDSTRQIIFFDNEGGRYQGTLDKDNEFIQGFAVWEEEDESDPIQLDFVRAEENELYKYFIPYPQYPDGSTKYTYQQPENCNDQWQTASVFDCVTDSMAFYTLMQNIINQKYGRVENLLIIKDEKLILEEYFFGYDKNKMHYINSCTKSLVSMLLGIALEAHDSLNADTPLYKFFPQFDSLFTPEKREITLKHVLTMHSGLTEDDDIDPESPYDIVHHMLSQPLESAPGEKFKYNNNGTNLLGSILYSLEGKQADEFAQELMFNKLGITQFDCEKLNGITQCHSDLNMLPRDVAKLGLLALNNGSWQGEQIVPKAWIEESTKAHVAESDFFDYGYQWWHRSQQNKSWWENPVHGSVNEHDMFLALGYGGQYIMVVRDLDLVIVITSSDNNERNGMAFTKIPMVIEEVVPLFE